ncbi:MAG TPA: hypothetical protein VHF22_10590, partial [Planctomycetota bacterium]|nr:hypothetical protein [Planctomycetota bacterium]
MPEPTRDAGGGRGAVLGWIGRALLFAHLAASPLVFKSETVEVFEFNKVALLVVAAVALAWLLAARALRRGRTGLRELLGEPAGAGVLLFLASAAISTATSMCPNVSWHGAHESFAGVPTMLAYGALFFATRALVRHDGDAAFLLAAPVIGAIGAAGYAFAQVYGVDPIRWGRTSTSGGFTPPFSTMGHPNFLAAYLAAAFPLLLGLALAAARARSWLVKPLAFLPALVAVAAAVVVGLTLSTPGWLALAAGVTVLALGWLLSGAWAGSLATLALVLPLAAAGLVAVGLTTPPAEKVLEHLEGAAERFPAVPESQRHIWAISLDIARESPVAGSGLDTFQLAFEHHRTVAYWN